VQRHEVPEQAELVVAGCRDAVPERPPGHEQLIGVGELPDVAPAPVRYQGMRTGGHTPALPVFAAVAAVATSAIWAVLQGLDGVGLKQAVEAWVGASGQEESVRFANAETVRWLEWGFQSFFRVLLGLTFVLFGAAILATRLVAGWLGWAAILAGVFSWAIGVDVGYSGLASGLQDALGIAFLVVALVFAFGILAAGMRARSQHAVA
jgi:hypothetical protein